MLNDLTFPSAQFLMTADRPRLLISSQKLMDDEGFPCDYDLVTLKTFYSHSERYNGKHSLFTNFLKHPISISHCRNFSEVVVIGLV